MMSSAQDENDIHEMNGNSGEVSILGEKYAENGQTLMVAPTTENEVGREQEEDGTTEDLIGEEQVRQTITLSLDEATQFLLQQQSLTTQAVEMEDGTYQLFDQPVIQVQREDGTLEAQTLNVEVLQALQGELVQQLQPGALEMAYSLVGGPHAEEDGADTLTSETNTEAQQKSTIEHQPGMSPSDEAEAAERAEESGEDVSMECMLASDAQDAEVGSGDAISQHRCQEGHDGEDVNENDDPANVDEMIRNLKAEMSDADKMVKQEQEVIGFDQSNKKNQSAKDAVPNTENNNTVEVTVQKPTEETEKVVVKKESDLNDADLSNPIPLSNQTVITVNGKKCVLSYDAKTQQLCAYPIKITRNVKRRGRPKLSEAEKVAARQRKLQQQMELASSAPRVEGPSEKSSAAETLLELSNTGTDGVRRSGRARKKAKLLDDFEELDDSDDDGPGFEDNQEKDPDISLDIPEAKRRRMVTSKKDHISIGSNQGNTTTPGVKRGRGRPRRYPLPGQQSTPKSIPAVMLPSADGQTLVMAPIQDLHNLQQIRRQLPNLIPKPLPESSATTTGSVSEVLSVPPTSTDGATADSQSLSLACPDGDTLPLDASAVLDSGSMIPQALQGDNIPMVEDCADPTDQGEGLDASSSSLMNMIAQAGSEAEKSKGDNPDSQTQQPTVIQIPDNLLASLGFKKDPIKIGLKASERELEKLKCPKCDFQGYYTQQYRNHIATHGEDIQKCKCCSFLSLDSEELLQHFKEYHPRCICPECGYMAEHAYIIKRHMMRHDIKSCTCSICGKVYKDMYILKMHVKMVHMPAEVLFECDVCAKKFTRKAHLKRHMRIHEPEKPYKCSMCDYRGCERSDISKHMLIHQEPKHACERCGKTFRHIKNKELHVKRHYGQRDYKCGVCDFFGYTFTDIRKHIERKHQDIKTLICDKCGRPFRSETALKEHYQNCNVMMIEQVLAIPTSGGRTNQATIQIPTQHLGPHLSLLALDGASPGETGVMASVQAGDVGQAVGDHQGVSIMVASSDGAAPTTEQHIQLVEGVLEEDEEEEFEEEEEEDESVQGVHQAIVPPPGKHYISTSSGIQLVSSVEAVGVTNPQPLQGVTAALALEQGTPVQHSGIEDQSTEVQHQQHHLMPVKEDGGVAEEEHKTEVLVSMEEWNSSTQVGEILHGIVSSTSDHNINQLPGS